MASGATFIHPVEPLKNPGDFFGGDAYAFVSDLHLYLVIPEVPVDPYPPSLRRVLNGILNEVFEDEAEGGGVGFYGEVAIRRI